MSERYSTPLDVNIRIRRAEGNFLANLRRNSVLVGSLIYLTITRSHIAFTVCIVSRYMQSPWKPYLEASK